ncbi:DUF2878 family protein [Mitsuaria sp. TWR114]|uniref:DUF2878 family protein n=1 Tax=Mitsuaria sp. TWR114 TaxID=2601731 RepID=UPI00164C772E|nr:DUF2878 family protein [Mitsuaria sp. TWR114]
MIGLVQFCLFQAAWFACVLGAAHGQVAAGVMAVAAVVLLHLAMSPARAADLALTVLAMLMGLAWDSAMVRQGWVQYASPGPLPQLAPIWILALWALFATLLRGAAGVAARAAAAGGGARRHRGTAVLPGRRAPGCRQLS